MDTIKRIEDMQARCEEIRLAGQSIVFVPTMGYFHDGHLELMRVGRRHADVLVISIFVNPTQFGPNEDFEAYPRDMAGDLAKAEAVGVDLVFVPDTKTMYTDGFQTTVHVDKVTQPLCGKSRPVHFDGVTTVVAKLFQIVKPHIAVFGQKDYQQLTVVGRMVKDLNMDIQIIGVKTVREPDGLAMSSRNAYLSEEERASALSLKKSLDMAAKMAAEGERDAKKIEKEIRRFIEDHPHTEIDYVTLCHPVSLEETDTLGQETLLALAVRVGKARLIDNVLLKQS